MTPTRQMIKQAVAGLSIKPMVKEAIVPIQGGQIPPPPGDPNMGGMPPGGPGGMPPGGPGGMPPGGDPNMGGMPPMDPSMGGMPPGAGGPPMDPSMMGPPPMDPSAMGAPPEGGVPQEDIQEATDNNQQVGAAKQDVLVPLNAMADYTRQIIEATKGKRTADAPPPKDPNAVVADPAMDPSGMGNPAANIGGAPADMPMPMGGMPPVGGKQAASVENLLSAIKLRRGYK